MYLQLCVVPRILTHTISSKFKVQFCVLVRECTAKLQR